MNLLRIILIFNNSGEFTDQRAFEELRTETNFETTIL